MQRLLFHHPLAGVVFALIVGTGLMIAASGMAFYSRNLRDSGIRQGEYLALFLAFVLIRGATRPLRQLTLETEKLDQGHAGKGHPSHPD